MQQSLKLINNTGEKMLEFRQQIRIKLREVFIQTIIRFYDTPGTITNEALLGGLMCIHAIWERAKPVITKNPTKLWVSHVTFINIGAVSWTNPIKMKIGTVLPKLANSVLVITADLPLMGIFCIPET